MKKYSSAKGFTLIELLVVVAIIAILSGTILVALNSARSKAKDARIQSELDGLRSQVELFYSSNNNSYGQGSDCNAGSPNPFYGTTNNAAGVLKAGIASDAGGASNMICGASNQAWAAAAKLSTGVWWCVDSNGDARSETNGTSGLANGFTTCP